MPTLVSLDDIHAARQRIAGHVHRTTQATSRYLSERTGAVVSLKQELFQKTGSFKVRGVINTLQQLSDEERSRGVISLSAGNHAQALAWGASRLGIRATIVMPANAAKVKVDATRGYGGEIVQTAGDLMQTALDIQRERGLTLVHPFDDLRVIAGQGTVGLEIMDDVPHADVVIVACGGGGLISGVAAAVKRIKPTIRVIGVEPEGADGMSRSLAAGSPQRVEHLDTVADGLAAPFAGAHTLAHVQAFVDEMLVIPDSEILEGMRVLMERCKLYVEPSAGAAVAPLLTERLRVPRAAHVVPVVCGGNIAIDRLKTLF